MCNIWTCRILYMYFWTPRSDLRVANRAKDETSEMQAYSTIHVGRLTNERTAGSSRDRKGGHETNVPEPGIIASSPSLRRPNQKIRRVIPGGNSGRSCWSRGESQRVQSHTCLWEIDELEWRQGDWTALWEWWENHDIPAVRSTCATQTMSRNPQGVTSRGLPLLGKIFFLLRFLFCFSFFFSFLFSFLFFFLTPFIWVKEKKEKKKKKKRRVGLYETDEWLDLVVGWFASSGHWPPGWSDFPEKFLSSSPWSHPLSTLQFGFWCIESRFPPGLEVYKLILGRTRGVGRKHIDSNLYWYENFAISWVKN